MKKPACTIIFALAALHLARAVEPPSPGVAAPALPAGLEVKNKSSFTFEATSRSPFWPIGWKPVAKQAVNTSESAGPQILPSAFLVSTITSDQSGSLAIINGKIMAEGEVFGLKLGNQTIQITVKAIQDGQVILLRRDEEIIVPLRRR